MCESEGERTNTPYASEREKQTGKDGHAWCTGRAVDGGEKAWAALPILRQISQPDAEPTSEDVAKLLSTPVTGIASTLGPSQEQLENAAVRFETDDNRRGKVRLRSRSTIRCRAPSARAAPGYPDGSPSTRCGRSFEATRRGSAQVPNTKLRDDRLNRNFGYLHKRH